MSIHDTLTNKISPEAPDSAMKPSSNYAIFIVNPYAYFLYGIPCRWRYAKLPFHKLSAFWHALLLNKLCQIF